MTGAIGALRVTLGANTASFEQGMRRAGGEVVRFGETQRRGNAAMGQYRAGMQQLGFQINDVAAQLASGARLSTVFVQQSSQVIQAIQLMSGGASRFATFMGGPWGIALTAGAAILAPFIGGLFDTRTELEKGIDKLGENAREAELARQAQEAFGRTLPGVEAAIRSETEALLQQNRGLRENQQLTLERAQRRTGELEGMRSVNLGTQARLLGELADAERSLRTLDRDAAAADPALMAQLAGLEARVQSLRRQIADARSENGRIQADIERNRALIREAQIPVITGEVEAGMDRAVDATNRLADAQARLNREWRMGLIDETSYRRQMEEITRVGRRQIEAAQRAAREANRTSRDLTRPTAGRLLSPFGADRSGVPISGRRIPGRSHQGVDLTGNVGDPVVAPESGTAFVRNAPGGLGLYVEIRADSGARNLLAHLSAARVQSGQRVEAGQLVGLIGASGNARGPHLHWQRKVNGQWVDPMRSVGAGGAAQSARQAQREAERAAEEAARNRAAFEVDMRQAEEQLLQARRSIAETVEQQLVYELRQIETDRAQAAAAYDEMVRRGQRTEAEAILYDMRQAEIAQERERAARQRAADAIAERQAAAQQEHYRQQQETLRLQSSLAETASERRRIELEILQLTYEARRQALEEIVRRNRDAGEVERARAELSRMPANLDLERRQVMQGTRGPLEAFLAGMPRTAEQMRESLEGIAVEGFGGIASAAASTLVGLQSVGAGFKALKNIALNALASIAEAFIQRGLVNLLSSLIPGFGGGGGSGIAMTSLGGGLSIAGKRAAGGPVLPGRTYLVGEKGPELLRMGGQAGHVIANDNIGGAGGDVFNLNFTVPYTGNLATKADAEALGRAIAPIAMRAVQEARRRRP